MKRKKLTAKMLPNGRSEILNVSLPLDQTGYEMSCYAGRRAYLWIGPNGDNVKGNVVLTIDVAEVKRLLKRAGHIK